MLVRLGEVPDLGEQNVTDATKTDSCLIPTCISDPKSRGLCHSHYQSAWNAVNNESTTWEELEEHSLAAPSTGTGRKNHILELLEQRRKAT